MSRRIISSMMVLTTASVGCLGPMTAVGPFADYVTPAKPAHEAKPEPSKSTSAKSEDKPVARGKTPTTKAEDRPPVRAADVTTANVREKLEAIQAELAEASRPNQPEPSGDSDQ